MKKIYYLIMCLTAVFSSCTKDNEQILQDGKTELALENNHFYGIKYSDDISKTRGIAQINNLWYPGSQIRVRFLNDPYNMAAAIETYAKEWEQYADISFEFIDSGYADVRIGFDWNQQRHITWSYVGTDCKKATDQNEATMSFAYFDVLQPEDIKGDVLRAFGQVLGLELEHRHLEFNPGWTNRIAEYWQGEIEDIPWQELQEYVFTPLTTRVKKTDQYDPNSIMVWPFPRQYAANTPRDFNTQLSDMDKLFIGELYPISQPPQPEIPKDSIVFKFYGKTINVQAQNRAGSNLGTINWGDGTTSQSSAEHTYSQEGEYTVTITSDPHQLEYLFFSGVQNADIYSFKCDSLRRLDLYNCGFNNMDFNSFSRLEHIYIYQNNPIGELNLTNSRYLEAVEIILTQIGTLDLSNSSLLRSVDIADSSIDEIRFDTIPNNLIDIFILSNVNSLQRVDIPFSSRPTFFIFDNCPDLEEIIVSKNLYEITAVDCPMLREVDIAGSTELEFVDFDGSGITNLDLTGCENLISILIFNTPLETDHYALMSFAESLPYVEYGEIFVSDNFNDPLVSQIVRSKGWLFITI